MKYKKPLKSASEADAWIRALVAAEKDFHFDAAPSEIRVYWKEKRTLTDVGALFNAEEVKDLRNRLDELFTLLADPFEPLVRYSNVANREKQQ